MSNTLEIPEGKEDELRIAFEVKGHNWEAIKKNLEEIAKKEKLESEINGRLTNLAESTEDHFTYLLSLIENYKSKKLKITNPNVSKKSLKEAADNWLIEKINNKSVDGNFLETAFNGFILETAFSWFNDKGFLKFLGDGILGFFLPKAFEEYKKRVSNIENNLSPESINNTKSKIKEIVINSIPINKKPGIESRVDGILNNMSYERLVEYHSMLNGISGISYKALIQDFGNISDFKEAVGKELADLDKKAFDKISTFIFETYGSKLDEEEQVDLKGLISKYITNGNLSNEKLNQIFENKGFKISDLYPFLGDGVMFMFELVGKGIISIMDLEYNFRMNSLDIIEISGYSLGFSNSISIDSFIEKLNKLQPEEKALFIGILYRKGGLFLDIAGNIAAIMTRTSLDIILGSNSGVDGLKMFRDGIFKGPEQQLRNISRLEEAITGVADNTYITKVKGSFKRLQDNYKIMSIIADSEGSIDRFKGHLNGKNSEFIRRYFGGNIDTLDAHIKSGKFDEISKLASQKVGSGFADDFELKLERNRNHFVKEKAFGFGKSSAMQKLNRAIEDVARHQQNVLDKGFGILSKFRETLSVSKISHLSDKLVFEFESKTGARTFLRQMNVLAQNSPELIKGIFNKLPIISVLGLAASGEEGFWEAISKESKYLIPIVGPLWIIGEGGFSWQDGSLKIENPENILLGGGLLTLDGYFGYKALNSGKFLKFISRPILDFIDIGKAIGATGQKLYKTARTIGAKRVTETSKVVDIGKDFFQSLKSPKLLKSIRNRNRILFLFIASTLSITGMQQVLSGSRNELEELRKHMEGNGEIDFTPIRDKFSELETNKEKIAFIKPLFTNDAIAILNFEIEGSKLKISSTKPEELNGLWFIHEDTQSLIAGLGLEIEFEYEEV